MYTNINANVSFTVVNKLSLTEPLSLAESSEILLLVVFFVVGLCGNASIVGFSLFFRYTSKSKKSPFRRLKPTESAAYFYLLTLCLVHVLFLMTIPLVISDHVVRAWLLGNFTCRLWKFLNGFSISATFLILLLSYDRFLTVTGRCPVPEVTVTAGEDSASLLDADVDDQKRHGTQPVALRVRVLLGQGACAKDEHSQVANGNKNNCNELGSARVAWIGVSCVFLICCSLSIPFFIHSEAQVNLETVLIYGSVIRNTKTIFCVINSQLGLIMVTSTSAFLVGYIFPLLTVTLLCASSRKRLNSAPKNSNITKTNSAANTCIMVLAAVHFVCFFPQYVHLLEIWDIYSDLHKKWSSTLLFHLLHLAPYFYGAIGWLPLMFLESSLHTKETACENRLRASISD